jgi:hypothetical protein
MFTRKLLYKSIFVLSLLSFLTLSGAGAVPSGSAVPTAGTPVFVTTAGQSADAHAVKLLLDRGKVKSGYDPVAEADKISGTKTLLLVMGGSSKGLGAAGMDEDEEISRITRLLEKAKKEKLYIVGVHIGGESRRGPLSAKFINLVAPQCNYIIVKKDGNKDSYFTKLGEKMKIPVTVIDETLDLSAIFKTMFANN